MQANRLEDVDASHSGETRARTINVRYLAHGRDGSPDNYAAFVTKADDFGTPRHKHNFDQLRYVLEGSIDYGKGFVTPAGTVVYVPEGVAYGPQERAAGTRQFTVQFGGPSGFGYVSNEQRQSAIKELEKVGSFEKGYYSYIDERGQKHNQDAFQAAWQKVTGEKMIYPPPRYHHMVAMNPANYAWMPTEHEGVDMKWLGRFTERDVRVRLIRVDAGATLEAGLHDAPEVLFLAKGHVRAEGEDYPQYSGFAFAAAEGARHIQAIEPSEFLSLQMAKF